MLMFDVAATRLRELAAKATPGPWLAIRDGDAVAVCTMDGEHEVVPLHEGVRQTSGRDARLIALAPELAARHADLLEWADGAAGEIQAWLDWAERIQWVELDGNEVWDGGFASTVSVALLTKLAEITGGEAPRIAKRAIT